MTMRKTETLVLAGALLLGCSDDDSTGATTTATQASSTQSAGGSGGAGTGGSGGSAGSPATLEVLASFDEAVGELPEGLALRGNDAYVGFATLGAVQSVSTSGGAPAPFAQVMGLPARNVFLTGLTFDGQGQLYAAVPSFVPSPAPGVYRAAAGGGDATLFATDPMMAFPSGLEFHPSGDLFVTDSATGIVFRVSSTGTAQIFLQDALLLGDKTICGNDNALFDIGANGIAVTANEIFVANTDQATIVRIPIEGTGAGVPEIVAGPDCATLGGIDGIARAADGSFYAALNRQNKIAHVSTSGAVTVVVDDPLLDFPASVSLSPAGDALFITNFALENAFAGNPANPALLRWLVE
jgi:hypothetical protein